jgi:hypothetical protein
MLKPRRQHTTEVNVEADPIDLCKLASTQDLFLLEQSPLTVYLCYLTDLRRIHSDDYTQNQEKRSINGASSIPYNDHHNTEGTVSLQQSFRSFVSSDHPFNMNEQREELSKRWTTTFSEHQKE